jgi:hypothetical protein
VSIPKHLTQPEAQLLFFVPSRHALDLGHVQRPHPVPRPGHTEARHTSEIEVRIPAQRREAAEMRRHNDEF